jgi:transposase
LFTSFIIKRRTHDKPRLAPEKRLGVRQWVCGDCVAVDDRDHDAAVNIARIGYDTLGLK